MGFLGLVPADKLAAFYNVETQELVLSAEGVVIEATYGFKFVPAKDAAWTYSLEAWTGPITGQKAPYTYSQTFHVFLVNWRRDVIIRDSDNPKGVPVEIKFGGIIDPPAKPTDGDKTDDVAAAPVHNEVVSPPQDVLNVLYDEAFTIKQRAEMPKFGSIDLKFDPQFLVLETAGIDDGNIVWKFNSLQTGTTQVVVSLHGGIATYVRTIVYTVNIFFLPLGPGPVIINNNKAKTNTDNTKIDKTQANVNDTELGHGTAVLGFLGRVEIARRKVLDKYPSAALYYVQASTKSLQGVTSPYQLTLMEVMFRTDQGVATVNSTGYGEFGPIEIRPGPILGNANIDWPVGMDATEADAILKKEGYDGAYYALTLRKPLYPGVEQDYYTFSMVHGPAVSIGVKDQKASY